MQCVSLTLCHRLAKYHSTHNMHNTGMQHNNGGPMESLYICGGGGGIVSVSK